MSTSHAVLKFLRKVHLYLGIFLSPALLFFAFTGALQTFSLHETTQGSSYKPPAWIATLAQLHKKQTAVVPVHRAKPPADSLDSAAAKPGHASSPSVASPAPPSVQPKSHLPMKLFFLLVALGLFTSTLTGLYMAWMYQRRKGLVIGVFVAGVVVPLLLLPF